MCWAFIIAELVSAVRYLKLYDVQKVEYSYPDFTDFIDTQLCSDMKCQRKYIEVILDTSPISRFITMHAINLIDIC